MTLYLKDTNKCSTTVYGYGCVLNIGSRLISVGKGQTTDLNLLANGNDQNLIVIRYYYITDDVGRKHKQGIQENINLSR